MAKEYYTVATFKASRGNKWWRVNRNEEGDLSCTCPGWCRRVAKDGGRSCKHVRKVMEREAGSRTSTSDRGRVLRKSGDSNVLGQPRIRL